MDETPGLRETHKRRTREALSQAAVEIVASEGIEALTAHRVAERAQVSRRTLFNYFHRVEDLLTATIDQATADTMASFIARPADEGLHRSISVVLEEVLTSPAFEQARALEQVATTSPATRRFLREYADAHADAIEAGLRRRIGPDADPVYVAGLASATVALMSRMTRLTVAEGVEGAEASRRHRDLLREAVALLFSGFDEAAAARPASRPASGPASGPASRPAPASAQEG
jgi:AcrR family transcriptional regulator